MFMHMFVYITFKINNIETVPHASSLFLDYSIAYLYLEAKSHLIGDRPMSSLSSRRVRNTLQAIIGLYL